MSIHDLLVPKKVLLSFFQGAKERLEKYTHHHPSSSSPSDDSDNPIPIALQEHQRMILQEQKSVLKQIVNDYNHNLQSGQSESKEITADLVQESLRLLGKTNDAATGREKNDNENNESETTTMELLSAMREMNDVARLAFCRSILCCEYYWYLSCKKKQQQQLQQQMGNEAINDDIVQTLMMLDYNQVERNLYRMGSNHTMDRQTALEFCGLCTTAVKLPQIQNYIQNGTMTFFNNDNENEKNDNVEGEKETKNNVVDNDTTPQQRVSHLQQMVFCALGYEPSYGAKEIQTQMMSLEQKQSQSNDDDNDHELKEAFATFLLTVQEAVKDAVKNNLEQHTQTLSDQKDGGVTRVVGVKYTEREIRNDGISGEEEAPMNQRMEEQNEETQRSQLQMAQKAALLQQSLLDQLLEMGEEERERYLQDAKEAHESFLREAVLLPPSERVAFMQNMSAELQKKLLMYKVWEGRDKS